jgi:hypothetical protein
MLTWQEYQEAVAFLYENLEGEGRVEKDVRIKDVDTGNYRQIDVLLTVESKGHYLKIVIDAKYHARKLDVKEIEGVIGLANAIGADKAAIVAANGWSKAAEKKAKSSRLDLRILTTKDALSLLMEWARIWTIRSSALTKVFGPPEDELYHAIIPLGRESGGADVLIFREFLDGYTYLTSDLTSVKSKQVLSEIGNYELMICTKNKSDWAAGIISDIAQYTLEKAVNPGDTMDMDFPDNSNLKALVFVEPALPEFEFWGRKYSILLCVGITESELEYAFAKGSAALLDLLEDNGILPYTDFDRVSVV